MQLNREHYNILVTYFALCLQMESDASILSQKKKKKKKAQLELGRPIWATMTFPFILDSENKDQFNKMMSRIVAEGFQL
jgi:hypothetical protein